MNITRESIIEFISKFEGKKPNGRGILWMEIWAVLAAFLSVSSSIIYLAVAAIVGEGVYVSIGVGAFFVMGLFVLSALIVIFLYMIYNSKI